MAYGKGVYAKKVKQHYRKRRSLARDRGRPEASPIAGKIGGTSMTENQSEALEPARKKRRGRIPQETLDAIRERLRAGRTQAQVAREFGLASSTIARHVKNWPEVRFQPIDSLKYPIRER